MRAVVTDDRGGELLVRSPEVADVVATALNAGPADLRPAEPGPSSTPRVVRYSVVPSRRGMTLIMSDDRGRDRGRVAPGFLGRTSDHELGERIVERLNQIDPAVLKPRRRGPVRVVVT